MPQATFSAIAFEGFFKGKKNMDVNSFSEVKICMPESSCLDASVHVELQANVQFQNCRHW